MEIMKSGVSAEIYICLKCVFFLPVVKLSLVTSCLVEVKASSSSRDVIHKSWRIAEDPTRLLRTSLRQKAEDEDHGSLPKMDLHKVQKFDEGQIVKGKNYQHCRFRKNIHIRLIHNKVTHLCCCPHSAHYKKPMKLCTIKWGRLLRGT